MFLHSCDIDIHRCDENVHSCVLVVLILVISCLAGGAPTTTGWGQAALFSPSERQLFYFHQSVLMTMPQIIKHLNLLEDQELCLEDMSGDLYTLPDVTIHNIKKECDGDQPVDFCLLPVDKVLQELIGDLLLAGCQFFHFKEYKNTHCELIIVCNANRSESFQLVGLGQHAPLPLDNHIPGHHLSDREVIIASCHSMIASARRALRSWSRGGQFDHLISVK